MKLKIASALATLSLIIGTAGVVTTVAPQTAFAQNMRDCYGLTGDDLLDCKANRADREKNAQIDGERGRKRGYGAKAKNCEEYAEYLRSQKSGGYSVNSATSYWKDCDPSNLHVAPRR